MALTGRSDEAIMVLLSKQGVGKLAKEELQKSRYAVDIVIEIFGVSKVERGVGRFCPALASLSSPIKGVDQPVSNMFLSF